MVNRLPLLQFVDDGIAAAPDEDGRAARPGRRARDAGPDGGHQARPVPAAHHRNGHLPGYPPGRPADRDGRGTHAPAGFTEISGVCTDPTARGQGLGTRLLLAIAAGIRERGETSFLDALASNTGAVRLYEHLGFALRQKTEIVVARRETPGGP